jgi:hypothetical protein
MELTAFLCSVRHAEQLADKAGLTMPLCWVRLASPTGQRKERLAL